MISNVVLLVRAAWHVAAFVAGLWPVLAVWCVMSFGFAGCWSITRRSAARSGDLGVPLFHREKPAER